MFTNNSYRKSSSKPRSTNLTQAPQSKRRQAHFRISATRCSLGKSRRRDPTTAVSHATSALQPKTSLALEKRVFGHSRGFIKNMSWEKDL